MTFKEKLQEEHPEAIDGNGYCKYCPETYGYEPSQEECPSRGSCTDCWNREMPDVSESNVGEIERRVFSTGAVRDISEGKGRMDLLPWAAILEVSKHCENGTKKYGEHNVDKGIPTHSLCDSAARHLAKYIDGQKDEPHLLAAAWNLLWAIQMEIKHPELCDIPWKEKKE